MGVETENGTGVHVEGTATVGVTTDTVDPAVGPKGPIFYTDLDGNISISIRGHSFTITKGESHIEFGDPNNMSTAQTFKSWFRRSRSECTDAEVCPPE